MNHKWRYRIQKVLPIVYDDSMSYYEVLEKLSQAISELYDDIDENLEEYIKEALPEIIADASYDEATDTLQFEIGSDTPVPAVLDDPISRISINGVSRPVVDSVSRTAAAAAQTTAAAAQTAAQTAQTTAGTAQSTANSAQNAASTAQSAANQAQTSATYASTIVDRLKKASWLYQKDICFYGDSTIVVANNYAGLVHASSICRSVTTRGVSGNTLTNQGLPIIQAASDLGEFDYVFVCYGINDWSGISRYNWARAVETAAKKIISDGSEPVFVFPWVVYIPTLQSDGFINNYGCDMPGYVDAAIEVCEQLNVKYFNLCQISGVNKENYTHWLTPSANGYYLHENAALGEYVSKAILTGNYNTGKCYAGRFNRPFYGLLPTNWGYASYGVTQGIMANMPSRFRKGHAITITSARICEFMTISCGDLVRVTGYAQHAASGGYMDFYYIDNYNQSAGAQHICRVNSGSEIDFVFAPSYQGGSFKLCAQASEGGNCLIMDLAVTGSDGNARLSTSTPTAPGVPMSFENNVTLQVGGYIQENGGNVKMLPFAVRAAEAMSAGETVAIGNVGFYPQHVCYGSCHIGSVTQLYRVSQTGVVSLYVIQQNIPANTYIMFDECDITPSGFLYT